MPFRCSTTSCGIRDGRLYATSSRVAVALGAAASWTLWTTPAWPVRTGSGEGTLSVAE